MATLQKPAEPKHDPNAPWASDKLNRKRTAEYLTPLIASITQPFVISLNAPFGMGKTDFITRWQHHLRKEGYRTAYFDAWETDFSKDPMAAFMSSMKQQLTAQIKDAGIAESVQKKLADMTKSWAGFVRRNALPILFQATVGKFLDSDQKDQLECIGLAEGDLAKFATALTNEAFKGQEAAEKSMDDFRQQLSQLAQLVTQDREHEHQKKLIIFVDELDRCRPTYAIEVLEHIKHLFAVDGIVFVISIDEDQMRNAVSTIYGPDLDGQGYFSKFFDWRLRLPQPSSYQFADYLLENFGIPDLPVFEGKDSSGTTPEYEQPLMLVYWFSTIADAVGLSPRHQIRAFTEINLALRSLHYGAEPLTPVMGFVAALKAKMPDACRAWCLGTQTADQKARWDEAINGLPQIESFGTKRAVGKIIKHWTASPNEINNLDVARNQVREENWGTSLGKQTDKISRYHELTVVVEHLRRQRSDLPIAYHSMAGICLYRLEAASAVLTS